ncbi:MAG: ATP-dependent zinc metalloprotease FtsH [Mucinivorans sp.]
MANNMLNARPRVNMAWVWLIFIGGILLWTYFGQSPTVQKEIEPDVFWGKLITSGDLDKVVVVNKELAEVYLKKESIDKYKAIEEYKLIPPEGPQIYFTIGDLPIFEQKYSNIFEKQKIAADADSTGSVRALPTVPLAFEKRDGGLMELFWGALPFVLMVVLLIVMMRRMGGGSGGGGGGGTNMFNVGKSKAKLFDKDSDTRITFKDVAGLEEAKIEVMEVVDFLKNPGKYKELGGKIPKGALLVGPPGTGKTLLAKAVAGEANVPFFSMSGSDFVEMFVGVGASRVRDLFAQAKTKSPCIVFIDEIDAIGRARGKNGGFSNNDERENTLNQLLTEMDGFGTNAGVIILAATNRADILDKALLRAGRFDRQIHVDLPEIKEREAIFDVHLRNLKLDPNLDRAFLAKQTPGFSGADIANACNEAALIAARGNKSMIEKQDFLDAIDRIVGGLERKSKVLKPLEKRVIAYHEAGHATVSWFLPHANPLLKVTIIPRGRALGAAWYLPEERQITTREQMTHELASLLGGRVAEELVFGQVSSGALNDLERTTKQSYAMIAFYGMSPVIGNLSYYDSSGQDMMFNKPYSEQTALHIDQEVKKLIDECYEVARAILIEHKDGHIRLAEMLLEREVIFTEDLVEIFGQRPVAEK